MIDPKLQKVLENLVSADLTDDHVYVLERLRNPSLSLGSPVVPKLFAGRRIPSVQNFRIIKATPYTGGTEFILSWTTPEVVLEIAGYSIFMINLSTRDRTPNSVGTVVNPPATLKIPGVAPGDLAFLIQVVLSSGYTGSLSDSPTCTYQP